MPHLVEPASARRLALHLSPVIAAATLAGCAVGAPPGFSSGDRWLFPLVGPLEDTVLLVPASVHGHGPYLFAIDPDASISGIDTAVVAAAELRQGPGPRPVDESGTSQPRAYAELFDLKVAGLTIDRRDVMVFPVGFYDVDGRRVSGVLGRDVLADSLVFGFDRDQGVAMLSTVKAFTPPPEAIAIKYQPVSSRSVDGEAHHMGESFGAGAGGSGIASVAPMPRRLASAEVAGAAFMMHLDLGAVDSQLPAERWPRAHLAPVEAKLRLVDEAESSRVVDSAALAAEVALGAARATQVRFVTFADKRFTTEGVDGTLGLGFFQPYSVYASWDSNTYFLKARAGAAATITARLGRWGADLPTCRHAGCVTVDLANTGGGVQLTVTRDPEAAKKPLEVYLGVTAAAGKTAGPLVIDLPATADSLSSPLPAGYAGATLAVLDASPFPRTCPTAGGCIVLPGIGILQVNP